MLKSISKFRVIITVVLILFFRPLYFSYNEITFVNQIFINSLRFTFICVLWIYLYRGKISRFIILLVMFYIVKAISTIINSGTILAVFSEAYPIIAICLLIEIYLKKDSMRFVEAFTDALFLLVLANFIAILISPDGYSETKRLVFFLDVRNHIAPIFILLYVLMSLRNIKKTTRLRTLQLFSVLAICTIMIFHAGSGSNIIAWTVILGFNLFPYLSKKLTFLNIKTYSIIYAFVFVTVVFFNIQEIFADQLFYLLGKNVTFSGRVELWNTAVEMIKEKPLLGHGMSGEYNIIPTLSGVMLSAHNQFIQLAVEGGIISIALLMILVVAAGKKLYSYRKEEASKILSLAIFSVSLVLFSEAMGLFDFFVLLAFAYNIENYSRGCSYDLIDAS